MAGGQQITVSQGTISADSETHGVEALFAQGAATLFLTVALTGSAIASGQGAISANNDGTVALVGAVSNVSAGTVAPSWEQALTGSEATSGIGALSTENKPPNIVGQVITSGSGAVSASGNDLVVNITGEEAVLSAGFVEGGTQPITTLVSTSAAGTAVPGITVDISGIACSCGIGSVGVGQDADDTYISFSHGNAVASMDVALSGTEITGSQGTVSITGDITMPLTGEASTGEAGSLGVEEQYGLTGSEITGAQYNVGAPGGAALTGSEVAVVAGDVFTTNDRSFALSGQEITVGQGLAVTSYLAFVTGQELDIQQQEIGPRGAELTGQQINSEQGYVEAPHKDMGAGKPKGRKGDKGKDGKPLRFKVKIDDELFIVSSREEAEELYAQAKELAAAQAEQQAAAVVTGRKNVASENKTALNTEPVKLDLPQVIPDDNDEAMDFASKLKADLDQIYQRAAIEAELAIRLEKQRLLDEEENLVLLLLNQ